VTFSLHEGEILTLVGGVSSGKTMTVKTILDLARKTHGYVKIDKHTPMGVVLPGNYFQENSTVWQTMSQVISLQGARIHSSKRYNILKLLGLGGARDTKISKLSASQLTRLKLATAFINSPQILILDNAFADLEDADALGVRIILKALADRMGVSILVTSPTLRGVEEICDTIAILEQGRLKRVVSYNQFVLE